MKTGATTRQGPLRTAGQSVFRDKPEARAGAMQRERRPSLALRARRGFSFIEAVLAAALLGIVASAIFSVLGYVWASDREDTVRLGAAEVANRVIISYLDDETSIGKLPRVIDYGRERYRWELDEDTVRIEEPNRGARVTAGRAGAVPNALVKLKEIRVTVWQDDGTDASLTQGATPGVRINRLVNPIAYRGTDTIERLFNNPERMARLVQNLTGFEAPPPEGGR